jgi:hypothetical protein
MSRFVPVVVFAVLMLMSCTAAQKEAFLSDLERVRAIAGDVCLEHDGWRACLAKCQRSAEAAPSSDGGASSDGGGGSGGGR